MATRPSTWSGFQRDLPDGDGIDRVRELRRHQETRPVITISSQDTPSDKAAGLRAGLGDYMGRDFGEDELLARVEPVARRAGRSDDLEVGPLHRDASQHRVFQEDLEVELTAREFSLLLALARPSPNVCSRAQLMGAVWGASGPASSNLVDVYVRYRRTTLGPPVIRTVRGVSYALDPVQPRASKQASGLARQP